MEAEVAKVIAAVRPAVQADRGDIELVSVDPASGIIEVELLGACTSCPASSQTLKAGVERIIELELTEQEQADFQKSVDAVKELVQTMNQLLAEGS